MKFIIYSFILLFSCFYSFIIIAKTGIVTGLDIPRFVSLKSNDANLRIGPSINYPIEIKYVKQNLPIEIIEEFDVWRKVKDYDNNIGWLHKSLIKGDRYVLIKNTGLVDKKIYNRPNGKLIGLIQQNNILKLKKCLLDWCYVFSKDIKGWVLKNDIWGVYKKEIYNLSLLQPLINQYWKLLNYIFLK